MNNKRGCGECTIEMFFPRLLQNRCRSSFTLIFSHIYVSKVLLVFIIVKYVFLITIFVTVELINCDIEWCLHSVVTEQDKEDILIINNFFYQLFLQSYLVSQVCFGECFYSSRNVEIRLGVLLTILLKYSYKCNHKTIYMFVS